jgi:hypothetical protein
MRRLLVVLLVIWFVGMSAAQAQDTPTPLPTDTPTITPTPSDTPTPTPNLESVWTLPPPDATLEGTPGTPAPGQSVAFVYRIDTGQWIIAGWLAAILGTLWFTFIFWVFWFRKEKK